MDLSKTREQILSESKPLQAIEALAEGKIVASPELKDKTRLAASREKARAELSADRDSAYQSGAAINNYGDRVSEAANKQMKLIADNFVLGHEDRIAINGAVNDLVIQIKAKATDEASLKTAVAELEALRNAGAPDFQTYLTLTEEYDQIVKDAKPGYWLAASEKLKQLHELLKSNSKLLAAIAADQVLVGPRNTKETTSIAMDGSIQNVSVGGLTGKSFEEAKGVLERLEKSRKDDTAKVEAELKRLEVRAYDNLIARVDQPWIPKPPPEKKKTANGAGSDDSGKGEQGSDDADPDKKADQGKQSGEDTGGSQKPETVSPRTDRLTKFPLVQEGDYFAQLGLTVEDHTSSRVFWRNKTNEGAMIRGIDPRSVLYDAFLSNGRGFDDLKVTKVGNIPVRDRAEFLAALESYRGKKVKIYLTLRGWAGRPGDSAVVDVELPGEAS